MDITVTFSEENGDWRLMDLLGRSMGHIVETDLARFVVRPDGGARETMVGMGLGPYDTLDEALAAIETHTRGVCRRLDDASPVRSTAAD